MKGGRSFENVLDLIAILSVAGDSRGDTAYIIHHVIWNWYIRHIQLGLKTQSSFFFKFQLSILSLVLLRISFQLLNELDWKTCQNVSRLKLSSRADEGRFFKIHFPLYTFISLYVRYIIRELLNQPQTCSPLITGDSPYRSLVTNYFSMRKIVLITHQNTVRSSNLFQDLLLYAFASFSIKWYPVPRNILASV